MASWKEYLQDFVITLLFVMVSKYALEASWIDSIIGATLMLIFWELCEINKKLSKTEHSTANSTQSHTGNSKEGSQMVENTNQEKA